MFKRHYNIVIVACCFTFLFVNLGLASTAFSVHQPYIVALDGIGDTGGSLILSLRTFTSLLAMFFVDRYYMFFDIRRGVFLATLCTTIGFMIYSCASMMPMFLCGAVFMGLGYGLGGMVAVTYIVNRWFKSGIGSMVGIAAMGSSFASIVMPMIVVQIIEQSSLSTAFILEGCVALVVGLLVLAVLRNRPSDIGLEPFESKQAKKNKRKKTYSMRPVPAHAHRVLMVAITGVGIFSCLSVTYISVLATSTGYGPLLAASLVSVTGAALTASKFITGELFDHLGAPRASALVFAIGICGYALCSTAEMGITPVLIMGAAMTGAGVALGTIGISVWSIDLSNVGNRTREIRNFQVAYTFGGFIANTMPGIIKDLVGSYVVSYVAVIVIAAASAFVILSFYRTYRIAQVPQENIPKDANSQESAV